MHNMTRTLSNNQLYLSMVLFLLQPIMLYLDIPGTRAFASLMFICAFAYYCNKDNRARKVATSLPLTIWAILSLYHCINATIKQVPEVDAVDYIHAAAIYSCLGLYTYFATISFKNTIRILAITFMLYMVLAFFVCDFSSEEAQGRLSGAIYATGLAQTAAILFIYIAYLFILRRIKISTALFMALLPFIVILLTQTRNALAMVIIYSIGATGAFMARRDQNKVNKIFFLTITAAILSIVGYELFMVSNLYERFVEKSESHELSYYYLNNATGTVFDTIVGDRLFYYIEGWKLLLENPITGIGMWNFKYVTHQIYPLHSEYMIHLCEGGIIGISLWLTFLIIVISRVFKAKGPAYMKIMNMFIVVTILFCGIYAREFYYDFFYPAYALILGFYMKTITLRRTPKLRKAPKNSVLRIRDAQLQ